MGVYFRDPQILIRSGTNEVVLAKQHHGRALRTGQFGKKLRLADERVSGAE